MNSSINLWKRLLYTLLGVLGLLLVFSFLYQWGMDTFEDQRVTLYQSFQVVIESITTAGFGGHAPWQSLFMNLLVATFNLTGLALVFFALPAFVIPMFKRALRDQPPTATELTDHVIICSYSDREEILRRELESVGREVLFVEADQKVAKQLMDREINVILGDPTSEETLEKANINQARALVVDLPKQESASIILSGRRMEPDVPILSVTEDEQSEKYHRYAGADHTIRPRQALGRRLAEKAIHSVGEEVTGALELSDNFKVTELLVDPRSDLAGQSLKEAQIRQRFGVNLIGMWIDGEFAARLDPSTVITGGTILLATGEHEDLVSLSSFAQSRVRQTTQQVIIMGYGVTGRAVDDCLRDHDVEVQIVDRDESLDGVDVHGDITDPSVLEDLNMTRSTSVILTVEDDSDSIFSCLMLQEHAANPEILGRANEDKNTRAFYDAGAHYVLSISRVTGRMLTSLLVDREEILTPESQCEVVRIQPRNFEGQTVGQLEIRRQTGTTIVAVERDDRLITDIGPGFMFQSDDVVIAAGDDEQVNQFLEATDFEQERQ